MAPSSALLIGFLANAFLAVLWPLLRQPVEGAERSLSDTRARRGLKFDLCPQLDDALWRNLEVIRRADGIAPHEGV